jgi:hypothetical protein
MFHANRARKGAANPISGGTSPQGASGSGFRSGLLVFTLAVLALLGGSHVGTAAAAIQAAGTPQPEPSTSATTGPAQRVVEPTQTTQPNQPPITRRCGPPVSRPSCAWTRPTPPPLPVKARTTPPPCRCAWGRYQFPWNVTGLTRFEIDDPDGCTKVRGNGQLLGGEARVAHRHRHAARSRHPAGELPGSGHGDAGGHAAGAGHA